MLGLCGPSLIQVADFRRHESLRYPLASSGWRQALANFRPEGFGVAGRRGTQKPSSIHTLLLITVPRIARWRASPPCFSQRRHHGLPLWVAPASPSTSMAATSLTTVWNDAFGASGGGVSQQFSEPPYQRLVPASVQDTLQHHRGIPDVAYNADPNTPIVIYVGFFPNPADDGYYFASGTSEGPPQWAGIVADANQLAGHPLGFLNPQLYVLGATDGQSPFFHDITVGNDGFSGVPGYDATPGWDLADGWGTPNVSSLAGELAKSR